MIIIKTLFNAVVLNDTEFAIYDVQYPAEKGGKPMKEDDPRIEKLQDCDYGDLYIETPDMKYVFKNIYDSYEVVSELIEKIEEAASTDGKTVIDIGALGGRNHDEYYEAFDLEVYSKKAVGSEENNKK